MGKKIKFPTIIPAALSAATAGHFGLIELTVKVMLKRFQNLQYESFDNYF